MKTITREAGRKVFVLSEEEVRDLQGDNGGICITCGEFDYGVEPDAENYYCENCDFNTVQGIDNAIIMGHIEIGE